MDVLCMCGGVPKQTRLSTRGIPRALGPTRVNVRTNAVPHADAYTTTWMHDAGRATAFTLTFYSSKMEPPVLLNQISIEVPDERAESEDKDSSSIHEEGERWSYLA